MKKFKFIISIYLIFSIIIGNFNVSNAFAFETIKKTRASYVPGEIIVKYKTNKINLQTTAGRTAASKFIGSKSLKKSEDMRNTNISVLKITDSKTVEQKVAEIKTDANIEYAEPNYLRYPTVVNIDSAYNDTYRNELWGLDNTGQYIHNATGTIDADIDAPEAWAVTDATSSSPVIVAIIDTGVAYDHPDLINNMWDGTNCKDENGIATSTACIHGYDFEDNDNDPLPTYSPHGTEIAGIIAAGKNNGIGVMGIAPNAKIMALKFRFDVASEVRAINFAIANGAKIINASFTSVPLPGIDGFSQSEHDAIGRFKDAGGIFVAAAGNDAQNSDAPYHVYPSDYNLDNIISVAATDQNDNLASFSNYGITSVDVGAPGVNIYSTATSSSNGSIDTYNYSSGTSMAAPYVAGLAALIKGFDQDLTYSQIKNTILSTGDSLPALFNKTVSGKRINAQYAIQSVNSAKSITSFTIAGQVSTTIDENSHTILVIMPSGTDVTALVPTISITGSSVSPLSGAANDFSSSTTYVVTAPNSGTQSYTVNVTTEENPNIADVVSDTLALVDSSILGGNPDISHITSELTNPLPSSGSHGSTITWISNNSSYISNSGRTIVRPLFGNPNVNVLLTATITKGIIIDTKIFDMTVLAETISPELANASTSLAELEIDVAKDLTIGANLTIANTHAGATRSSIGLVATGTDKTNFINRYNIAIQTLSDANIASDKLDLLNSSILGGNPDISHIRVALTSPLPSSGSKGSVISWLSRIPEVLTNDGQTITRPAYSFGDVSVNLTATIGLEMPMICSPGDTSCGGIASTTKIFDLTILKLPASTSTMITSTSFTIGSSETSTTSITNIPFGTSKASFISSLTKGEPNQAWTDTGITDPVVTGNSLFVTAQDASTTKEYLITVNADPVNHEKSIIAFSFGQTEGVITGNDILVTLPYGTVLTSLIPSITLSGGTVSPIGGIAEDFTNSVVYKVTSDDSSTKDYTVTVRVSPNTAANIVSFGITNPISNGVISGNNITITVPFATSLVNLPITIVISDGASVTPMAGGTTFVEGVPIFYTVTAQDATTTKEYGVTVNIAANNAKDIGSFNFETLSPAVTGIINATNITLSVPYATNITSLIPTIGITGASSSPSSGVANNFSSPVTYTVTAADGSTKDYTVSVIVLHETTPPVITLSGLNSISITVGSSFTDPGATALDNVDGVTAVVVSGTVNTNTVGTYTITYTATDVAGNTATSTRTVIVNAAPVAASVNGGATPAPATTVATTTTIVSKLLSANGDYIFDQYDFSLMMSNWGKVGANGSDYNKSGKVDKYDFALLMLNWGK